MQSSAEQAIASFETQVKRFASGGDLLSLPSLPSQPWPDPMAEEAMYGLAGEITRAIEPHTEASAVAILCQTLTYFGTYVGRGPHVPVEGDQHHANIFMVLTGDTSKGRKGTSLGRVKQIFERISDKANSVSGLSSGEGLKWAVRDQIIKLEHDKKTGVTETVVVDEGVSDKRLFVTEAEFAQALRVASRPGNTLSVTIRDGWDGVTLSTLTKNDPVKATGAHIGIIGHITADELRAELTQTDRANGFANRFLFVCAKRSKVLPFGGENLPEEVLEAFARKLSKAASTARQRRQVLLDDGARLIWKRVYPALSAGAPGMFGAVTGRAEAQCLRLALIYALLDESPYISKDHLLAGLAVWDYCKNSARYIFGSALGDSVADDILSSLTAAGPAGVSRTDIRDLFKRHGKSERIDAALTLIERRRLAYREMVRTEGRSAERWFIRGPE